MVLTILAEEKGNSYFDEFKIGFADLDRFKFFNKIKIQIRKKVYFKDFCLLIRKSKRKPNGVP